MAIKGLTVDGNDFIYEAIQKGATTIVSECPRPQTGIPKGITYIKVADSKLALGEIAASWYGTRNTGLTVIGVTGTKGKTTTCHIIHHILTKCGKKAGLISSITTAGFHTTSPDSLTLHKLLSGMIKDKCEYAIIEVSSHGIDQQRIAGVKFDIGVLTNIAPEHLDYHKTFAEYRRTKLAFLKSAKLKIISPETTNLDLLPGEFNNLNAETAIKVAQALGIDRKRALAALQSFKLPQGRLEEIKNNLGVKIIIDFAHTPESLQAVLTYLKPITKGKLIAVFGCAGERDPRKRSKMGEIAGKLADLSIFTAEDPRTENVFAILKAMAEKAKNYLEIPERGEAIAAALSLAKKGDTVVICGKGHEKTMCYGSIEQPWSDQACVNQFLSTREDIGVIVMAAGMGKRMHSDMPKVLHLLAERPMIAYTLANLRQAGLKHIVVVMGYKKEEVVRVVRGAVDFAQQPEALGTGDAAAKGLAKVDQEVTTVVVLNGDDSAFYSPATISRVIKTHETEHAVLTFVSLEKADPFGLGRVIRDAKGRLINIVEEKDLTDRQKQIREVNDGLYVANTLWLKKHIGEIKKSPSGEYYIVDLIKMAIDANEHVAVYKLPDTSEWQGINTPEQLAEADKLMRERLAKWN